MSDMNASNKQAPRRVATGRAVTVLAAVLSGLQAVPAWAAPSQMPFLTRTSNPAHPNIVYTLDDSGSMQWQFMPDSSRPSNVDSYSMAFHHQDRRARVLSGNSDYNPQVIPTRTNDLIAARMRSPAWNTVYYNPEIRYHPWYSADGTQFEPANPRAAWIYPTNRPAVGTTTQQTNAINDGLAVNLVGEIVVTTSVEWCRSNRNTNANNTGTGDANRTSATCGTLSGDERYAPATYYLLSGANNNYTNFTRYRIMDATSFTRGPGRTDCSVSGGTATCTQAQEYQNFAPGVRGARGGCGSARRLRQDQQGPDDGRWPLEHRHARTRCAAVYRHRPGSLLHVAARSRVEHPGHAVEARDGRCRPVLFVDRLSWSLG
jgi:type IV pilus assembly protein PilY1